MTYFVHYTLLKKVFHKYTIYYIKLFYCKPKLILKEQIQHAFNSKPPHEEV